jgi:hypothetical protein
LAESGIFSKSRTFSESFIFSKSRISKFWQSPGFQNFGRVRDFKILAESGILKFWQSPGARGAPPGFSKIFLIHFLAVLGVFSPKMDMFRRHVKKSLSVTDHLRTHAVNDLP